ncbi:MAG: Nif3-like dinuclear metal center hexameric protein [Planctomycetota bacterium]
MVKRLNDALTALEQIAPLRFAESWDKVGLLIDKGKRGPLRCVFLCIDLTEPVLEEAKSAKAQLIVAYHPPIFEALGRLTRSTPNERIAADALAAGIAVYSPHTALDAAPGGVNDWLAAAFEAREVRPLQTKSELASGQDAKVVVFVPDSAAPAIRKALSDCGAGRIGAYESCSFSTPGRGSFRGLKDSRPTIGKKGRLEEVDELRLEMVCSLADLPKIQEAIKGAHPYEEPAWEVYPLAARPLADTGMGRFVELSQPATLDVLVKRVKKHLGLKRLRLAASPAHRDGELIRSVALCAGAGGSVLANCAADLYLSGEMRHHDALAALAAGRSVLLGEHSNTERGYLPHLKKAMAKELKGVAIEISKLDRDPFEII